MGIYVIRSLDRINIRLPWTWSHDLNFQSAAQFVLAESFCVGPGAPEPQMFNVLKNCDSRYFVDIVHLRGSGLETPREIHGLRHHNGRLKAQH